jgi:hypothetical protein
MQAERELQVQREIEAATRAANAIARKGHNVEQTTEVVARGYDTIMSKSVQDRAAAVRDAKEQAGEATDGNPANGAFNTKKRWAAKLKKTEAVVKKSSAAAAFMFANSHFVHRSCAIGSCIEEAGALPCGLCDHVRVFCSMHEDHAAHILHSNQFVDKTAQLGTSSSSSNSAPMQSGKKRKVSIGPTSIAISSDTLEPLSALPRKDAARHRTAQPTTASARSALGRTSASVPQENTIAPAQSSTSVSVPQENNTIAPAHSSTSASVATQATNASTHSGKQEETPLLELVRLLEEAIVSEKAKPDIKKRDYKRKLIGQLDWPARRVLYSGLVEHLNLEIDVTWNAAFNATKRELYVSKLCDAYIKKQVV